MLREYATVYDVVENLSSSYFYTREEEARASCDVLNIQRLPFARQQVPMGDNEKLLARLYPPYTDDNHSDYWKVRVELAQLFDINCLITNLPADYHHSTETGTDRTLVNNSGT